MRAFARKGYHACRVGEIAEEAGVAYGLVYHYFGSKEEVLETIFRDTLDADARARRARSRRRAARPREQVRKVTALLLRTWRRDPDLVRVLVHEVTRSPSSCQRQIDEIGACLRGARADRRPTGRRPASSATTSTRSSRRTIVYGALEEVLTGLGDGPAPRRRRGRRESRAAT